MSQRPSLIQTAILTVATTLSLTLAPMTSFASSSGDLQLNPATGVIALGPRSEELDSAMGKELAAGVICSCRVWDTERELTDELASGVVQLGPRAEGSREALLATGVIMTGPRG